MIENKSKSLLLASSCASSEIFWQHITFSFESFWRPDVCWSDWKPEFRDWQSLQSIALSQPYDQFALHALGWTRGWWSIEAVRSSWLARCMIESAEEMWSNGWYLDWTAAGKVWYSLIQVWLLLLPISVACLLEEIYGYVKICDCRSQRKFPENEENDVMQSNK